MNNIDRLNDVIYAVQDYMDETYGQDSWAIKDGANDWDADSLVEALYERADDTGDEDEQEEQYWWEEVQDWANIYKGDSSIPFYMARRY